MFTGNRLSCGSWLCWPWTPNATFLLGSSSSDERQICAVCQKLWLVKGVWIYKKTRAITCESVLHTTEEHISDSNGFLCYFIFRNTQNEVKNNTHTKHSQSAHQNDRWDCGWVWSHHWLPPTMASAGCLHYGLPCVGDQSANFDALAAERPGNHR